MGIKTKIEYADSTVNPVVGCTGCELYSSDPKKNHCYAASMVRRWAGRKGWPEHFNSPIHVPGRLEKAIGWSDLTGTERPDKPWLNGYPRVVFVNDLSDGFCPDVDPFGWLLWNDALDVMEASPHIWMLLTKWPGRMAEFFSSLGGAPSNFLLGTSVLRPSHNYRIRALLDIRGGFKWLSLEPLLETLNLENFLPYEICVFCEWEGHTKTDKCPSCSSEYCIQTRNDELDWVAYGGESGVNARPPHPDAFRSLRDQLVEAQVPQFFKQWGEWAHVPGDTRSFPHGARKHWWPSGDLMVPVGRKVAGRLLDGREHNEMPERGQR